MGTSNQILANEHHYGKLQGLNKKETAENTGDEQVPHLASFLRCTSSSINGEQQMKVLQQTTVVMQC